MRVLHVTSHLEIGGITSYVLSLAGRLQARGHEVAVAAGRGERAGELAGLGVDYWPMPLRTSSILHPRPMAAQRRLAALAREHRVELVHAHTRVSQVVGARVARVCRIPYVTTWHGFFRPNLGRRLWPCTGELTIAISEPVRDHLREVFHIPDRRIRLIPNGVDAAQLSLPPDPAAVAAYRAASGLKPSGPVIGSLGRLAGGGVKGFDLFLEAAGRLDRSLPGVQGLIVGEGPRRPFLEDLIERLGLQGRVVMPGSAPDVRVPLALMDVFVFSSRWLEGFGLSLIEAMAAGKPVVAARVGAVPTIIEDGVSGLLVPPEDPDAIAQAAARLLRDPVLARRLGMAARQRVRERFSLDRMTDQVEAVYRELVHG